MKLCKVVGMKLIKKSNKKKERETKKIVSKWDAAERRMRGGISV
jgi:hypothetical protein